MSDNLAPARAKSFEETLAAHRMRLALLIDLGMAIAEEAAARALGRKPEEQSVMSADEGAARPGEPTARFHRAAASVRGLIATDTRLARDQHERTDRCRVPPRDPRRALLRENLRRCIDPALDRTLKAELMRDIDREIEVQIATAPNNEVPIGELFCIAAQKLGLQEAGWKNIQTAILDFYSNEPWTPDPPPDPRSATMRLSYAFDPPQWVPKDPWMLEGAPKPWHTIPPRDEPPHDDLPPPEEETP